MAIPWESREGGFRLSFDEEGWTAAVAVDDESFYAMDFQPPDRAFLLRVQRFRREIPVADRHQFEAVIEGVLIGIEEGLRPMKLLERKVTVDRDATRADFVIRGKRLGIDMMERRRLIATGPVPPGSLFLLTAACPAEKFLVHRRTFEAMFDSFGTEDGP
jgi:hypothetical protein